MKIKPLFSGSDGNAYYISDNKTALLIECGVPFINIKKKLTIDEMMAIKGCLISHRHKDHCLAINDILKFRIPVYTNIDVINSIKTGNTGINEIQKEQRFEVGTFVIKAFEVPHDEDVINHAFYIYSKETKETLLFATDLIYLEYKLPNLNYIMIEANFDKKLLNDNYESGKLDRFRKDRILQSHMCIETTIETLKANDLSKVKSIHLIHLSRENSNRADFIARVQEEVGIPTFIGGE